MGSLSDLPVSRWGVVGLFASTVIITKLFRASHPLDAFPIAGSNTWLGSWWAGLKFLTNVQKILQEGYEKYNLAPFKVAQPFGWTVILSDPQQLEELAAASDDAFSFLEATHDQIQIGYTLGHETLRNPHHIITFIRPHLTRNLRVLCPDIREEIVTSMDEVLNLRGNEWKSVSALGVIQKIVCRATNRVFVGLPLYLSLRYTSNIVSGGITAGLFPEFMKPLIVRLFTNIPLSIARGAKLLGPVVEDRLKYLNEYGRNWNEMPNDFLSWLMEDIEGPDQTTECLTARILVLNFIAVYSTSHTFTQALSCLAANPQYIQPLREEVECIVEKYGWTKSAISKMHKVDSFLKESTRIEGVLLTTPWRKALTDFTFSDGTFIPKGTLVAAPASSLHHDENFYANPDEFQPFRFTDMPKDNKDRKQSFTIGTPEYVAFGLGRHSCPGRFFAAAVMKYALAHIVVTHDVKLEDGATRLPSLHIGPAVSANSHARIMFRNREH